MKKVNFLISVFISSIWLLLPSSKVHAAIQAIQYGCTNPAQDCLTINTTLTYTGNWPGGNISLSCPNGFAYFSAPCCVGSNASLSPTSSTATLTGCDCLEGQACLTVSNIPTDCIQKSGPACGANGNTINPSLIIECPAQNPTLPSPSPLTASCKLNGGTSYVSIDTGGSVTWSADASGGPSSTYGYSWSGTDSLSGATQSVNKTYSSTGTKTANVTVSSGSETKAISCPMNVIVGTPPGPPGCNEGSITMSVSPNPAVIGGNVNLSISGNALSYASDSFGGGLTGCPGSSGSSMTCRAANNGNYTWTHHWKVCAGNFCSDTCSKSANYSIGSSGNWSGACNSSNGKTYYRISGPSGIPTHAIKSDGSGTPVWGGKYAGDNIEVTPGVNFIWYSEDCGLNCETRQGQDTCNLGDVDYPPPQAGGEAGDNYYFKYLDGSDYDGFGVTTVPFYSSEGGNGGCSINGTAEGFQPYTNALDNTSSNSNGYQGYGSCCCKRYWEKEYFSRVKVAYDCEASVYPASLNRFFWPQFPVGFSLARTLTDSNEGTYGGCESQSNWGTPGGCVDTVNRDVKSLSGFHFDGWSNNCSGGWLTGVTFTVIPPVTLTVNKTGQGTVTESSQPWSQTLETTCKDNWCSASLACPYGTISNRELIYGIGCNNTNRGVCNNGNGLTCNYAKATNCLVGGTSCSFQFSEWNCYNGGCCQDNDGDFGGFTNKIRLTCTTPPSNYAALTGSKYVGTYPKLSATSGNNTRVKLTANPGNGYVFTSLGWGGCDEISGNDCIVYMDSNKTITANFTLPPPPSHTLTVIVNNTNNAEANKGMVSSDPPGDPDSIRFCKSSSGCSASFAGGARVTLTPNYTPANTIFTGWSGGGCLGIGDCTITMDADKTVTATFTKPACSYLKTVGGDIYSGGSITMSCSP